MTKLTNGSRSRSIEQFSVLVPTVISTRSRFRRNDREQTNNLGIPASDDATETLIRGGEVFFAEPFVADGEEIQLNDKRYGADVQYNSDTKTFTFSSGSTGEAIDANGAIGVTATQKSSNIQVGRYSISATDGSVINNTVALASRSLGQGENALMGVGLTKTDAIFAAGTGLQALPAVSTGATAKEPLTEVFRLTNVANENVFNVSVNGINGVIEIPTGNYVGSTLQQLWKSVSTRLGTLKPVIQLAV